jgi:hypothetical protein
MAGGMRMLTGSAEFVGREEVLQAMRRERNAAGRGGRKGGPPEEEARGA